MTNPHSDVRSRAAPQEFIQIAPAVCELLLGEPTSRSTREWRWGKKGSFRLKLESGGWSDFESNEGGGVLDLVMREERCDKAAAVEWLQRQGFLLSRRHIDRVGANRTVHGKSDASGRPHSSAKSESGVLTPDRTRNDSLRWIRGQILPIADAHDHPVRHWMAKRNLWRPELPLPPSLRWIPFDAPVFRRTHSGAGAIAFPLAPVEAWRTSYPETPSPSAVQLVCIDADGGRADYENSQGRRVDKPKFGDARLAVWTIGDVTGDSATVCEGAADALALAAREPDPVIATLTTPRPPIAWRIALSMFGSVTVWPDMDEEDEQGRRPGLDAAVSLAQARKLAGQGIEVMGVDIGKDAADAARKSPLDELDSNELRRFAADLQAEGMAKFEAMRYASTMLK